MRRFIPFIALAVLAGVYLGYRWHLAHQPFQWSGTVEVRTITVGSRVGGRVKEVKAREGDRVKAGQVLVVLEPGDLLAQRALAQAQAAQAQATYDKLKSGARPEEIAAARARADQARAAMAQTNAGARREEVAAAHARLDAAESQLAQAKLDAARAHELLEANAVTQAEVDAADTRARVAQAERDGAAQQVQQLESGARVEEKQQAAARAREAEASAALVAAGTRVEDLQAAEAALDAAKARLDQIDANLAELEIKAPRDARIESLSLRPGDLLGPSSPAATLLEDDQLYVRVYVPETVIGRVHVGEEVPVTVDSFPGKKFPGVVSFISEVGEYSPRNLQTADERADQVFACRVDVKDGRGELRAGMAAFVKVPR